MPFLEILGYIHTYIHRLKTKKFHFIIHSGGHTTESHSARTRYRMILKIMLVQSVTQSDSSMTQSDISGKSDMQIEYSESKKSRFFVQYRGKCRPTEKFARSLHKCQAPCNCKVIMTLRRL